MIERDDGFTLIELLVVLVIIAILTAVGMAGYAGMADTADGKGTQSELITAVKVQALHHLETGVFSDDGPALRDLEPTLRYSADGDPAGSIVVTIEAGRTAIDVCMFARTENGDWFSVHHSALDGDRFGTSSPIACTPGNVAGWSRDVW